MIDLKVVFFFGSAFAFSILLAICIFIAATTHAYPKITRSKKEKTFKDFSDGELKPFPSIHDKSSINLSVIIPAYNEEARLPSMLEECIEYLEKRNKDEGLIYEIILVNDGSKDNTVQVASEFGRKLGSDKFRILDLETNRGKGGAVRLGILSARGSLLLFADADGATRFSDLSKLEDSIKQHLQCDNLKNMDFISNKLIISAGSRAHLEKEAIASRSIFRTFLMHGFHALVWLFAVRGVKDTQCGFKLFSREAAIQCFESLHVERWAFDVELLRIAQTLKIPITEVPVKWTEIDGSKLTPFWSWIQMGTDLLLIWLRYTIGAWKISALKS